MEYRNYIDRGEILKTFDSLQYPYNNLDSAKGIVLNAPAADVAPRSEIAREIFNDIDKTLEQIRPVYFVDAPVTNYYKLVASLEEIKKKYTEE